MTRSIAKQKKVSFGTNFNKATAGLGKKKQNPTRSGSTWQTLRLTNRGLLFH